MNLEKKEIIIQGGRRIDLECGLVMDGIADEINIKRRFKFDPGAQNTCIAANDLGLDITEEEFLLQYKPIYRFFATGIDDKSEIVYYPMMVRNFQIEGIELGAVPIYVTFDHRFSKRLLG